MNLLLASASPRRAELLRSAGLTFEVYSADIDESSLPDEAPEDLVSRLSRLKADAIFQEHPDSLILAADTIVVWDGEVFGKPESKEQALHMLSCLSGDSHEVMTGFTILYPDSDPLTELVTTEVTFRKLSATEIQDYIATGEPMDKAGAYGIQAGAAHMVVRIEGSYTNIVGLPLAEVIPLLTAVL